MIWPVPNNLQTVETVQWNIGTAGQMDAWVRGVEAAMATDRRALCASAALQRAESPPVNLAGLDSAQAVRRRAARLNAMPTPQIRNLNNHPRGDYTLTEFKDHIIT